MPVTKMVDDTSKPIYETTSTPVYKTVTDTNSPIYSSSTNLSLSNLTNFNNETPWIGYGHQSANPR